MLDLDYRTVEKHEIGACRHFSQNHPISACLPPQQGAEFVFAWGHKPCGGELQHLPIACAAKTDSRHVRAVEHIRFLHALEKARGQPDPKPSTAP
ncbi:hypothetical protein CNY89_18730 [Amaricoccus sp. HAR-UPW-R2A-40]|nr:hypothetical protein CNY89_18730 [Amaricoccus sp. HAR-UPW-R2A-40]